jgi:MYXO-CTERM domain-containing protein
LRAAAYARERRRRSAIANRRRTIVACRPPGRCDSAQPPLDAGSSGAGSQAALNRSVSAHACATAQTSAAPPAALPLASLAASEGLRS